MAATAPQVETQTEDEIMFPSIYEHWGITLTVIGGSYILLALLWCRLLGFNRTAAGSEREKPLHPESDDLPNRFSDSETSAAPQTSDPEVAVRPDCCAKELLYTSAHVQCLTAANEGCPHRLDYGQAIFCRHPQRIKIVAQSPTTPN
jgi:hypothetical protein